MKHLLALLLFAGCSASWTALDADVDAARLDEHLATRPADTANFIQTAWLCVLHGRGCDRVTQPTPMWQPQPDGALEAQLARALATDGLGPVTPRLDAWLALADLAASAFVQHGDRADRLLSLAVERLGPLAARDYALVSTRLAQRGESVQHWLDVGTTAERWRRERALASWLAAPSPHGAQRPLAMTVALAAEPLSRRLFTGLDRLPDALPTPANLRPLPSPTQVGDPYALPARDAGVYRLQAQFAVTDRAPLLLRVEFAKPVRVWCDGRPLTRVEPTAREETWLDLPPGAHTLDLAVPIGQNGQPLALALLPGDRTAQPPPQVTWHATLEVVLDALREPTSAAMTQLTQRFPHELLQADAAVQRADTRETEALPTSAVVDALLAHWPKHVDAQLMRAMYTRESGQAQLAWQSLQGLEEPPPPADVAVSVVATAPRSDLLLERAMTYQALGLPDMAASSAEAAVQQQPLDCRILTRALGVGEDTLNRPLTRRLLAQPVLCPRERLARAFAQSMVGRLDDALATLLLEQAEPAHAREAAGLARLLAQTLHKPLPPRPLWGEDRQADHWQTAQEAELRHDQTATQAALHHLLTAPGLPMEARQKAIQAGVQPIWQPFVRDGEQIAQVEVTDAFANGSATVWMLDQEIVQLLPDGGAIRRVHQVVRVREAAAADSVGEIRVAEGADLELARTILPDGSLVLPAETDDKETISLRAVAAGTTVEFAQIAYEPADDPATGATRLPLFHMQSTEAPVQLSEYIVLVPQGVPFHLDASSAAGAPVVKPMGAFTAYVFSRAALPRVRNEPRAVRPERVLPTVRALARPGLEPVIEPWNEALAAYVQSQDPALRAWGAALTQVPESFTRWQKLASRLALTVQHAHEGGSPGRPETALTEGKGDRASTFYTLARQAGADACLVRVWPMARLPADDPLTPQAPVDPDDYGLEVVRLRVTLPHAATTTEIWYDPAQEGGRLDHVRAGLRGRQGLLCGCATPPNDPRVTIPKLGAGADRRVIDVSLDWAEDGHLIGIVHEELYGAMAASVRSFLRGNGANDQQLAKELAEGAFDGAAVQLLRIDGLAGDDAVTLAYEVTLAADRERADALDLDLWAEQLVQSYAQLPSRTTPLLFSHTLDLDVTLRVVPRGGAVHELPLDVVVDAASLHYQRRARREGDAVVVKRHLVSEPAIVAPDAYGDFAQSLRAIDAADHVRLRRTP